MIKNSFVSAVFLDRDGVINYDSGYLSSLVDIKLNKAMIQFVRYLNENKIPVFVVTNQSGISRGYFTEDNLKEINSKISDEYIKNRAHIEKFYYCPHYPTGKIKKFSKKCNCRKPKPGLLLRAANEYKIDLGKSWIIGDKLSDIEAGIAAGIPKKNCIQVKSVQESELENDFNLSMRILFVILSKDSE